MKLNKKGILGIFEGAIGPVVAGFYGWGVLLVALSVYLTPSHIVNRATERCISTGKTEAVCKDFVSNLSQNQRKGYIQDTLSNPNQDNESYLRSLESKLKI